MPDHSAEAVTGSGGNAAQTSDTDTLVWYVAYGSNLLWSRFRCYLEGGRPDGSRHTNPGARNRSEPVSVKPVQIPGRVLFAGHFAAWGGGGVAFFDLAAAGLTAGKAHLITLEQLADVVAQENALPPGPDFALGSVLSGGELTLAHARYETVLHVGTMKARPMLTLTSRAADLTTTAPSPAYLWTIAAGLRESHGWAPQRVSAYLATLPGVAGHWTNVEIEALPELAVPPATSATRDDLFLCESRLRPERWRREGGSEGNPS